MTAWRSREVYYRESMKTADRSGGNTRGSGGDALSWSGFTTAGDKRVASCLSFDDAGVPKRADIKGLGVDLG